VPLLPQPLIQRPARAIADKLFLTLLCHFILTVSPTLALLAIVSLLLRW